MNKSFKNKSSIKANENVDLDLICFYHPCYVPVQGLKNPGPLLLPGSAGHEISSDALKIEPNTVVKHY